MAAYKKLKKAADELLKEANKRILHYKDKCEELENREIHEAKKPSSRELNTLLKICIGMAIAGYKYNPKSQRNSAIPEIASDLQTLGISISDDTIRSKLKAAADLLPYEDD